MYNRDWRKASDYDYTKKLTHQLWAWEFLRRNKEYIEEWNLSLKKDISSQKAYQRKLDKQLSDLLVHGKGSVSTPGFNNIITMNDLKNSIMLFKQTVILREINKNYKPDEMIHYSVPAKGAAKKWGFFVDELKNPEIDDPSKEYNFPIFKIFGYYYSSEDQNLNMLPRIGGSEVIALFDLLKPIQKQLEHFKSLLEEEQILILERKGTKLKQTKIPTNDLWERYLRILDGKAANARHREIADIIFPDDESDVEKKVGKNFAQAKNMVENKGYLKILYEPVRMSKRK